MPLRSSPRSACSSGTRRLGLRVRSSSTVGSADGFNRAVALLHSFAYVAAEDAFRHVLRQDPQCAMAHWGIAMSYYHQLWEPPIAPGSNAQQEIEQASAWERRPSASKGRSAASKVFQDTATSSYANRALDSGKRWLLTAANPNDVESRCSTHWRCWPMRRRRTKRTPDEGSSRPAGTALRGLPGTSWNTALPDSRL